MTTPNPKESQQTGPAERNNGVKNVSTPLLDEKNVKGNGLRKKIAVVVQIAKGIAMMVFPVFAGIILYEHYIREGVKHIPEIITSILQTYVGVEPAAQIVSLGQCCVFLFLVGLWISCYTPITMNNQTNSMQQEIDTPVVRIKDRARETTHMNFHKITDSAIKWKDCSPYYKQDFNHSIGILTTYDGSHGTCFRVGRKRHVMTAYHVVANVIDEAIHQIAQRIICQQKPTETIMSETAKALKVKNPDDMEQILRTLLKTIAPELSFTYMLEELETVLDKDVMKKIADLLDTTLWKKAFSVRFDETDSQLTFSYDIPFADEENDVIVLEILGDDDLPKPVILDAKDPPEIVNVIGYSTKSDLIVDMACKVYKDPNELQNDINVANDWWENNIDCQSHIGSVRKSLMSMTDKIILNTSESFEHGASGSPITKADLQRKIPLVYMMYQRGYPHYYYESKQRNATPPNVRFESGITMKRVAELIRKGGKETLYTELFLVIDDY